MEGKSKSLKNIEEKMEALDQDSFRHHVLESAKNFKTSWIELGRALYTVWKDKLYKDWGYGTIDIYTAREIGIKKQTAMKLLRSYYFLEKEEPALLAKGSSDQAGAAKLPSYESIDLLRQAKNKKSLEPGDYATLKKDILENGKDPSEAKRELTSLIRQREEIEPEEAHVKKRIATLRRFLGTLKALKQEIEMSKLLPLSLIKEAASLINKIEEEIS